MSGYLHEGYARALSEFGRPRQLPRCGGWILEREIPGSSMLDAMGCYPLFCCESWAGLPDDLLDLRREGRLVSLVLVSDPFGAYSESDLREAFDVVTVFKSHVVVDLQAAAEGVSRHHRYYAKRALRSLTIEACTDPHDFLEDWLGLYEVLVRRHEVRGIQAFSRKSFERQLTVPGLVMLLAKEKGMTVGAQLWFVQDDVAYSHLEATNERGYQLRASYGLYWSALSWFAGKLRWLDLGAGAGAFGETSLASFKRGWSPESRPAYLCGCTLLPAICERLTAERGLRDASYFPPYRAGEFA